MAELEAFKVIPQTHNAYADIITTTANIPARVIQQVKDVNNHFLVKDPTLPDGWGWFNGIDFHKFYKWTEGASFEGFAPIEKLPQDD